jgi:hypothetical protein
MNKDVAVGPSLLDRRRERLTELRQRLVAVSLRSRSLRLTRTTRSGALDLQRLAATNPAVFTAILDMLGREGSSPVALCSVEPSRDARELADDVAALAHAAEAAWSETGARDLAVGFPFLEGRAADGTWIRAPLLLYPVRLGTTSTGRLSWIVEALGPPELNESLAQALARLASVRLTFEGLVAHDDDGSFRCDAPTWGGFVRYLRSLGFNLGGSREELPRFEPLPARSREEREAAPIGAFDLHAHVVLGRFPRSDSAVVSDYDELLAGALDDDRLGIAARLLGVDEASVERVESSASTDTGTPRDGWDGWQVFASDDSQDEALGTTREGGLVVQGPPGTGKSQMIANLIASAVADDRRVLVICQKRAALDVVAHRLESAGLREPIAVVYDVERDRAAVCESIARTLGERSGEGIGSTTVAHELGERAREHTRAQGRLAARLEAAQTAFTTLAGDGHRPGLAALTERAFDDDGRALPALGALAAEATEDEVHALLPALELVARDCAPLASPHPLAERGDWGDRTERDLAQTFNRIRALADAVRRLDDAPAGAIAPGDAAARHALWAEAAVLLDPLAAGDEAELRAFLLGWAWTGGRIEHGEWARVMALLVDARAHLLQVPEELVLEKRSVLDAWVVELQRLMMYERHWYRHLVPGWWMRRRLPVEILDRCASLPAPLASPWTAAIARALCEQALAWQELIAALPTDNPFFELGLRGDVDDLDGAIALLRTQHARTCAVHTLARSLRAVDGPYARMPDLERHTAATMSSEPLLQAALRDRARARLFTEVEAAASALAGDLRSEFLAKVVVLCASGETAAARTHVDGLTSTEPQALEAARLDARARDLPPWAREFLRQWRPSTAHGAGEDALRALDRAWSELALEGRTAASIEGPLVDPELLDRAAAELDTCLAAAGHGVLARFSQRVASALAEGSRSVALRKLGMDVAKKRNRATMRRLVERYWDQGLASVRPIWFCSPEAVAALFPLRADLFDLVVLDEASQCPVEAALPTLARARRALIAGDDQQMPPAHFFRASAADADDERDDADELALLATDSVLALARVAFPGTVLRWHYRSRHEALIAFSNAAFYGHRLITAPRAEGASGIDGLRWIRVPGLWQDQTNAVEAAKVSELVAELLCSDPPPSVGVIAFNKKQADLILQLVDQRAAQDERFRRARDDDGARSVVEQLFVRNLENVQGDERDVIIVSLGYGPSELGGRVHARFGPLGQEGGEKRLNVAVTRAKIGLTVVTSIEPEDLDTSDSKHVGPKLLKTYLAFVRAQSRGDAAEVERLLAVAAELGGGKGVTGGRAGPAAPRRVGERVARELANALERAGLRVQRSFGLGHRRLDLVIGRPRETAWRLGIDCAEFLRERDGLTRDVYGPRFWKRLGWRVIRVSPRSWAEERAAVVDRVLAAVAADE